MNQKNTLDSGRVRYIVFKEKNKWFGAALEFNIVEEGDDPLEVLSMLFEAIEGYARAARKARASISILNQKPDQEYERMWRKHPSSVYTFGERMLVTA